MWFCATHIGTFSASQIVMYAYQPDHASADDLPQAKLSYLSRSNDSDEATASRVESLILIGTKRIVGRRTAAAMVSESP
jgi:hypothetical protein